MRIFKSPRAGGAWGIAFVVLLLLSAAMASLPTAAESEKAIVAFYRGHASVVILQQVVGAFALVPLVLFARSLDGNRWLLPALFLVVASELITNMVPLVIMAAPTAHPLTLVEDGADSALFISVALFLLAATLHEVTWLRVLAYVASAACVFRAFASPLGVTALDQIAPIAFLVVALVLAVRLLLTPTPSGN